MLCHLRRLGGFCCLLIDSSIGVIGYDSVNRLKFSEKLGWGYFNGHRSNEETPATLYWASFPLDFDKKKMTIGWRLLEMLAPLDFDAIFARLFFPHFDELVLEMTAEQQPVPFASILRFRHCKNRVVVSRRDLQSTCSHDQI